jgi:parvulin-like peptidyl-prolyl cis-trans isomerase-like protein
MTSTPQGAHRAVSARASVAIALALALVPFALGASGCASKGGSKTQAGGMSTTATTTEGSMSTAPAKEPDHIRVQHILIGFTGSVRGKNITRTPEEARTLAYSLLDSAKAGTSFDDLVVRHTDDSPPGIYGMSNLGVVSAGPPKEYPREGMVPAFGNVGFKLAVGEIGIADYDPKTSPFGYHVIKRVE